MDYTNATLTHLCNLVYSYADYVYPNFPMHFKELFVRLYGKYVERNAHLGVKYLTRGSVKSKLREIAAHPEELQGKLRQEVFGMLGEIVPDNEFLSSDEGDAIISAISGPFSERAVRFNYDLVVAGYRILNCSLFTSSDLRAVSIAKYKNLYYYTVVDSLDKFIVSAASSFEDLLEKVSKNT